MRGFFAASRLVSKKQGFHIPQCGACGLYKKCNSPKMEVDGEGRRKILIIGEAPGAEEDRQGKPFVGPAGQYLRSRLKDIGINLRKDCWITNALICRPPKNATPDNQQIAYCQPNLLRTVRQLEPEIIVPLGATAVHSLMSHMWRDEVKSIMRWIGWQIPYQPLNCWILPNLHPAYLLRMEQRSAVPGLYFKRYLARIATLQSRPWREVPNYQSQVERIYKAGQAASAVREMVRRGGRLAFDYETNMLKPDHPDARIVSCSVCWEGKWTVAYPFLGEAIDATFEMVRSPLPKIASNAKFEDRWTRKIFGKPVRNWNWDTMLAAHVIDNRSDITSIKFQAFVLLGLPPYDHHIKQFLHAKDGNMTNDIQRNVDLKDLLLYNGLDSLVEFLVADIQKKELRICD